MFELSSLTPDMPLAFVALACLYNIIKYAIDKHHERKTQAIDAATHERIVELTADLSEARNEIRHLRAEVAELKREGA